MFELICDNTLAATLIGWKPSVSLDEGLVRVIDYVSTHRGAFKPDVYTV